MGLLRQESLRRKLRLLESKLARRLLPRRKARLDNRLNLREQFASTSCLKILNSPSKMPRKLSMTNARLVSTNWTSLVMKKRKMTNDLFCSGFFFKKTPPKKKKKKKKKK